jgi:ArsR family transcriptional regulator
METRALEALSDDNRLAIVTLLAGGGELCVCDVSESLGISSALASHHLKKLREAGLVDTRRKGPWLHCSLRREALLSIADELRDLALQGIASYPSAVSTPKSDAPCCAPLRKESP